MKYLVIAKPGPMPPPIELVRQAREWLQAKLVVHPRGPGSPEGLARQAGLADADLPGRDRATNLRAAQRVLDQGQLLPSAYERPRSMHNQAWVPPLPGWARRTNEIVATGREAGSGSSPAPSALRI